MLGSIRGQVDFEANQGAGAADRVIYASEARSCSRSCAMRSDLPEIPGGWEVERFEFRGASVEIFVPVTPDELLDDDAVQRRNRESDAMPYWAWLWDSAPSLACYLCATDAARGARGLEVGSGLGLVGVALAKAGAGRIILTDRDPDALRALDVQVRMNGLENAGVQALDWNDLDAGPDGEFDVIVACDVIYEGGSHAPLIALFDRYLASGGTVWIADPGRSRTPLFVRRAEEAGFVVSVLSAQGVPRAFNAGEPAFLRMRRAHEHEAD